MDTYVFGKDISRATRGKRILEILSNSMVRRAIASKLDGKRIGDQLPAVQRVTIECEFTKEEREHYDGAFSDTSVSLFGKDEKKGTVVWQTMIYRKLCLLSSWLGFVCLLHYKVGKLKDFRKNYGDALQILRDIRTKQRVEKVEENKRLPLPDANDVQAILRSHCTGSPKLRQLLKIVAEIVILRKEKVILWVNTRNKRASRDHCAQNGYDTERGEGRRASLARQDRQIGCR